MDRDVLSSPASVNYRTRIVNMARSKRNRLQKWAVVYDILPKTLVRAKGWKQHGDIIPLMGSCTTVAGIWRNKSTESTDKRTWLQMLSNHWSIKAWPHFQASWQLRFSPSLERQTFKLNSRFCHVFYDAYSNTVGLNTNVILIGKVKLSSN